MCEICRSVPCNYRCPNYIPHNIFHKCYFCKDEIQIGEEYIEAHNGNYAHLECCGLSDIMDTLKFLDVEVRKMEDK